MGIGSSRCFFRVESLFDAALKGPRYLYLW